ncbi:MAG: flippase-like domain-containing protein [Cryomorphaceae bacterium]|nr:flippase-like domain-containing protein [Cryomorphaceae bacterium]
MAKSTPRAFLTYALFLGLGGVLFYLAFRHTEWTTLINDFRSVRWPYLIISALMGYYAYVARGFRWNMLLHSMNYSMRSKWSAVHGIALGYFSNLVIPRSGEVFRCTAMYRAEDIPVNKLLGTVILERLVDLMMLALLFFLGFVTNWSHMVAMFSKNVDAKWEFPWGLAVVGLVVLLAVVLVVRRFQHNPLLLRIRNFIKGISEGLRSFKQLSVKQRWKFVFYTFQIWIMYFLMVYIVFFALDSTTHLTLSDGVFLMVAGSLGMVIPTPGGIGSYHFLMMTGLAFLGVDKSDGMSFGTIVHTTQLAMTLLAGLVGFLYLAKVEKKRTHG